MTKTVSVKTSFADIDHLLDLVAQGTEVVLTRDYVAVARLLQIEKKRRIPRLGTAAG